VLPPPADFACPDRNDPLLAAADASLEPAADDESDPAADGPVPEDAPGANESTDSRGSLGLPEPAPNDPAKRGFAQLPCESCSGAVPCRRATELAISWERLGGNGE
jgi:hypothetical protein